MLAGQKRKMQEHKNYQMNLEKIKDKLIFL